jgi:hypothetical protein
VGSRDGLHEERKALPLPEVEPQPTCPTCDLVNAELACYVCNCKQIINGQSGTKGGEGEKKEHKETINKQEKIQIEKGTGQRKKTQTPICLIPSSIFPRSLYKFQTMTPIFRSH